MLTVENGIVTDDYNEFIDIGRPIPPDIIKLTSITNGMLRDEGLDERTIAQDIADRMAPGTLMIAHNCQFDLSFVYFLLKRHFLDEADEIVSNVDWLDTLTVLKDRKEYPHRLNHAVKHYGLEDVQFHRAIDDTKALREVAIAMRNERDDLREYKNIFGFNPKYGVSGFRFPFIEYKAQYFTKFMVDEDRILPRI